MRKLVGLLVGLVVLAVAGTALAGQGATNSNGDFADLSVKVTPPISGTAKAPRGVGLTFGSFVGNRINANRTINPTTLTVRFNQNFTDNGLRFPGCTINPKVLSKCPAASKVGSGTAEGELLSTTGGPPTYVPATLAVYNGKPFGSKAPTEIFIASVGGKPATELDFSVTRVGRGLTFTQLQFPNAPSSGPTIYLTKFSVTTSDRTETRTIKGKKVKIHLLEAPTVCHGSWTFTQTFGYAHQAPLTATDSQPCIKG
ncbi:MAG: hypothetical protein ACRDNK_06235 [Solirubrobacteraceae bacterium]